MKKANADLVVKIRYKRTKVKRHIFLDWVRYVDLSPDEAVIFTSLSVRSLAKYYEEMFRKDPRLSKLFHASLKEHGINLEESEPKLSYVS